MIEDRTRTDSIKYLLDKNDTPNFWYNIPLVGISASSARLDAYRSTEPEDLALVPLKVAKATLLRACGLAVLLADWPVD